MSRVQLLYDSTNPFDIPADAGAVAGYLDGKFAWPAAGWARFAGRYQLRIAVFAGTDDGQVLDVETGDATPEQAPGWVRRRMAAGVASPIIYCNRSTWPAVQASCQGLPVRWWISDPTGVPHLIPGTVATQFAWPSTGSGGHWDLSVAVDDLWPAPPDPDPPAPAPDPPGGADVLSVIPYGGQLHSTRVTAAGDLVHRFYDPSASSWVREVVAQGLPPATPLTTLSWGGQYHVFLVDGADQDRHWWYDPAAQRWESDQEA